MSNRLSSFISSEIPLKCALELDRSALPDFERFLQGDAFRLAEKLLNNQPEGNHAGDQRGDCKTNRLNLS